MTATATPPKPRVQPTTAMFLWWLVPIPVRTALRARVPLDGRMAGGEESLIVSVGSGVPLRWLQLEANAAGEILCRLWEVRQRTKQLACEVVHPDALPALLQKWALAFGLGA